MQVCGLDVHKDTVFCATYNGKQKSAVREYLTLTCSIREMGAALREEGVHRIAMESTGIYWIPVWNILEAMGFELLLVNPFLIKQMPGRKSDVKDAQWIATLLQKGLLRSSLVPPPPIRDMRVYSRKYVKLTQRKTATLQAMERTLEMCNIRLTSFVSTIGAKSVLQVIHALVNGETDPRRLTRLVHTRITNRHGEKVTQSLEGYIPDPHRFSLQLLLQDYELIHSQMSLCLEKPEERCKEYYSRQLQLLETVPGIDRLAAMMIIAESGGDMTAFENSGKFTGWTGLRPRNDESAGKYKSTATTKGNKYLRTILVQCAWAASRTKGSYFQEKFHRLALRKSRKKALIAIARKLGVIIWNMLQQNREFLPEMVPVHDPVKLAARMSYHQKEFKRLELLSRH